MTLIASYIVGSFGRGEQDHLSDLDVLAVVKNGSGKVPDHVIYDLLPRHLAPLKPSISWYGEARIRGMFKNGDLFAWHVFQDSIPIYDPQNFIAAIGQPSEYTERIADISSFRKVLEGIPAQIQRHEGNTVYEAGLIYVCLRNICMAASSALNLKPDFSRYSAFKLANIEPCPISRAEFDMLMLCRMAAQRGAEPPASIKPSLVLGIHSRLTPWLDSLGQTVERSER
jgi:predicted nucleotidyltransferase